MLTLVYGSHEAKPALMSHVQLSVLHVFNLSGFVMCSVAVYPRLGGRDTLFNIFSSDLDEGVESTLSKFADDTNMWGKVDTLEVRERLQLDLDRLQKWADENRMGFNVDKRRVLHLGRRNPHPMYRRGSSPLESTEAERDLGVIIDSRMNMSRQCQTAASKASQTLSCIQRCISSWCREVKPPSMRLWSGHSWSTASSTGRRTSGGMWPAWRGCRGGHPLGERQQGKPYEERLRDLTLFSLSKRRLRGDLVTAYKLIRGDQQDIGRALFSPAPPGVMRNNGHMLMENSFRLEIRRQYFTVRVAKIWNQLPKMPLH
ncbi:uncharacterized protein LOC106737704 isoform X1 [Alligator mississippiensis]|uniref:uncharacterized protein LOC106737704 isoform X1 n=1 Tax=Alligator mississippiensis TaxID=8496 RepID=UPI002877432C|nr:uncharacterized protein LOC106737704 isoform X1 [Alligator mississippiensis]XP_059581298.1 uncharacterized protein LOC106737704 isoform X1 [Alligator mississippiensis]XP_059581299.1 uncharacterized protein LOC106737704 isoform X1 [Alligator mississippiensis]